MTFLKSLLPSVGIISILMCLPTAAQARPRTAPSEPPKLMSPSSSLGGPITPTQPDFFSTQSNSLQLNTEGNNSQPIISAGSLVKPVERKPAPLVDDPPRPAGGFLKIDLD
jgi:hypothetical protein